MLRVFDCSRFSAESKAARPRATFIPFGIGPRNCIGLNLALLEVKVAVIRILHSYSIRVSPETEIPQPEYNSGIRAPKGGIKLIVVPRGLSGSDV